METQVCRVHPKRPNPKTISSCARIIRNGGLVAFPTETVYGLGADALNAAAVRKIYKAKGRPQDNPMIVHVASVSEAKKLAKRFPPAAARLARKFWPGPLTIILPKAACVPKETTAGLKTVAIRMPDHPAALALIRAAHTPIAAPSANTSGKPSPTDARHVIADLRGKIDAIIDGGSARIGVESTVIDLTPKTPTVLRPGGVTVEELRKALGKVDVYKAKRNLKKPRSPGMKYRHYAPKAKVVLIEGDKAEAMRIIAEMLREYKSKGKRARVLRATDRTHKRTAADLYRLMRRYDREKADIILAEATDEKGLGLAIMNRLRKAATKTIKAGHARKS